MPGVSLVETMVAVAVLAVMAPLGLAAILQAGTAGQRAGVDSRAPAIAERCLLECRAARRGNSAWIPQAITAAGGGVALAFDRAGSCLGTVSEEEYGSGLEPLGGPAFLARIAGKRQADGLLLTVRVEHPVGAAAELREGVEFHTRLP